VLKRPKLMAAMVALLGAAAAGSAALALPPRVPPALRQIVRQAAGPYWFDVLRLDGRSQRYDGRWCPPTGFRLFLNGRYLGMPSGGGEACGFTLIDRADSEPGRFMLVGAAPVFSPDRHLFAAAAHAGRADVDGVSIWEVRPRGTARLFFSRQQLHEIWRIDSWQSSRCVALSVARRHYVRRHYELRIGPEFRLRGVSAGHACGGEVRAG
jgi:hypothetical protein